MLAQAFVDLTRTDRDLIALVTGWTGEGKSMLVQRIVADYICPYLGLKYDLDKYMFLSDSADDFAKLWVENPRYSAIQVDEAVDMFFSGDWAKVASRELQKSATKARGLNKIVFLLIPNMLQMTKYFRDRRARVWIHIIERGVAVVFVRSKNFASRDAWGLERLEKVLAGKKTARSIVLACQKLDTYCITLNYGKWGSPLFGKYLKKKVYWNAKKVAAKEDVIDLEMREAKMLHDLNVSGISQKKIAAGIGKSVGWVNGKIKKARTIKDKPY